MNLYTHVENAANPAANFIIKPDGSSMSYEAFFKGTARYANSLVDLGIKPGERVAIQCEKSSEMLMLIFACLRMGAVFLPLNTAYTPSEVAYFTSDSGAKLLVCEPGRNSELPLKMVTMLDLKSTDDTFETVAREDDDLACFLYTSGTTGRSKGAMLTHDNLASNAYTLKDYWQFTSEDVLLHALPIYHTHGLFVATNVIALSGASMIFLPKFDANEIMNLMPRATTMMGVPTFYVRLCDHEKLTVENTKHMRLFISGSAPLLAETHESFKAKTGQAILERYGMTETNMNTSNPYEGERVAGTVGFPLPGVSLRITDGGRPLPQGEIGLIEVKGPNVFKGYWNMPEKTMEEFRADGFFITGDLGKIDSRGYVHIVGRGKDLVITGGFNVYPKEIEEEIDAIDGVFESAVIGLAHKDFGEAVTAVVVLNKNKTLSEQDVIAAIVPKLAKFKHPKRVLFIDDLPRNAMGKVQKNLLRDLYKTLYNA
jgi:malonyl-CoA/methylmalonyl-CoA synthetase